MENRNILLLSILLFLLLFLHGCVEIPHWLEIYALHNGSTSTNLTYAAPGNHTLFFNMSRYTYMYYNSAPRQIVYVVLFEMCGHNDTGSYPENITIYYPQFGKGTTLHPGNLTNCTNVTDWGLLDSLLNVEAIPLEGGERQNATKFVQRYPLIQQTGVDVDLALWNDSENIYGVNYTCFDGDANRIFVGTPVMRETVYGSPSILFFTCPAYSSTGTYNVTVYQIATFNGLDYDWHDVSYVTQVIVINGTDPRDFLLEAQIGSDSPGVVEIKTINISYETRMEYSNYYTSTVTLIGTVPPPWASDNSTIEDTVVEAEGGVSGSYIKDSLVFGSAVADCNISDSEFYWSTVDCDAAAETGVHNSVINASRIYVCNIQNSYVEGSSQMSCELLNAQVIQDVVLSGTMINNFTKYPPSLPLLGPTVIGCNGTNAEWMVDGAMGDATDITFLLDQGCFLDLYNSHINFKDNNLFFSGTPRFRLSRNSNITFSNLLGSYPLIGFVGTGSEFYLRDVDFAGLADLTIYGSEYTLGNGFVAVNTNAMPMLENANATIVIKNMPAGLNVYYHRGYLSNYNSIIANGMLCGPSRCTGISYDAGTGTYTINVTGLSSYAVGNRTEHRERGGGGEEEMKIEWTLICPDNVLKVYAKEGSSPISNVRVVLQYTPGGYSTEGIIYTNSQGTAEFNITKEGRYRILASKDGYESAEHIFEIELCPPPSEENVTEEKPEEQPGPPAEQPEAEEVVPEAGGIENVSKENITPPYPAEREKPSAPEQEAQETPKEEKPQEDQGGVLWIFIAGVLIALGLLYWFYGRKRP